MYCKRSGFRIQPMVEAVVVLVCRYTRTLLDPLFLLLQASFPWLGLFAMLPRLHKTDLLDRCL